METDTFLTIAELSLALIGFAALVVAFRTSHEELPLIQRGAIQFLVEIALVAFALSLLPVLLESFGISGTSLWRACSLFGALLSAWHITYSWSRARHTRAEVESLPGGRGPIRAAFVAALVVVANLLNASGWLWPTAVGPYLALVITQLGAACVFFVLAFLSISDGGKPAA